MWWLLLLSMLLPWCECFHVHHPLTGSHTGNVRRRATGKTRHCGLFDGLVAGIREQGREVSVQHVLLSTEAAAKAVWNELVTEGPSPETVGRVAREKSECGSAKKSPDARLAQLRGQPGELVFRRGQMATEFERIAFEAPLGALQPPFKTQFGTVGACATKL